MNKIALSFVMLVLIWTPNALGQTTPEKTILTMGKATDDVIKAQKRLGPIVDYLASQLNDVGIREGELVLAGDNKVSTLIRYINEGQLDIAFDSVFPTLRIIDETNAIPILNVWRNGKETYRSLIIVKKNKGINQLEDLKGKLIAFEHPESTPSYFLPKFTLQTSGFDLVNLPAVTAPIDHDKIGYVFAKSEINMSAWVFYEKVDAAAFSSLDWNNPEDVPESYKKEFKILYQTQKVPTLVVMLNQNLDNKLKIRIKDELLKMHTTSEGKKALQNSKYKIARFTELTRDTLLPKMGNFLTQKLH